MSSNNHSSFFNNPHPCSDDPFSYEWVSASCSSCFDDSGYSFDNLDSPGACSTSNLSTQKSFKYDVFLSFRGEDTRKNFVDHLYHALKDKSIYTYKDDEKIQKGNRINDELIKAIQDSRFYIIVFSKNYASSSWCLDELVNIMECHKMCGHTAYPVFYDVKPTEVRNQSGSVKKAFSKNKNKEGAKKWKGALKEAADLAGWELRNAVDGYEAKLIKKIVQEISLELRSINFGFDEELVGMETRVKDVVSSLEMCIDEVRMIGIKSMGGARKTNVARGVFDHLSSDFEATSFVENVREVSNGSLEEQSTESEFGDVKNQEEDDGQLEEQSIESEFGDVKNQEEDDGSLTEQEEDDSSSGPILSHELVKLLKALCEII